jgi:hypothetical protein
VLVVVVVFVVVVVVVTEHGVVHQLEKISFKPVNRPLTHFRVKSYVFSQPRRLAELQNPMHLYTEQRRLLILLYRDNGNVRARS